MTTRLLRAKSDTSPATTRTGLLEGFDLSVLDRNSHGISGWACGSIEPSDPAAVLVRDTWGRALVVADETTTNGFMFLIASGPVGDFPSSPSWRPLSVLYANALREAARRLKV